MAHDTSAMKLDSRRELTNSNPSRFGSLQSQNLEIVSFETEQARIMLPSRIGASDLRSRYLHVEPYVQLHLNENRRLADSAPYFARLARFSINWQDPLSKNLRSCCSSRHKPPKPESSDLRTLWCGRRDLNSRTIFRRSPGSLGWKPTGRLRLCPRPG
jgi:hypothetical protein